jgi:acetoin utilization deacetylase AcuC-like enzyme
MNKLEFFFNRGLLNYHPTISEEGFYRFDEISKKVVEQPLRIDWKDYLGLVHSPEYIAKARNASIKEEFFAYMHNCKESFRCATIAAGMAVESSQRGLFSLARPPGHHARPTKGDGYSIFNNIAIASKDLIRQGMKVAIVDFDAHHGDGTQDIFLGNNAVQYFSIHEMDSWPFSGEMGWNMNAFNYPVRAGSDDRVLLGWARLVQDKVSTFNPDILAISAGFDGFKEDRIAHLDFSLDGYFSLGTILGELEKKTFAVLEGGYHNRLYSCALSFKEGFNSVRA